MPDRDLAQAHLDCLIQSKAEDILHWARIAAQDMEQAARLIREAIPKGDLLGIAAATASLVQSLPELTHTARTLSSLHAVLKARDSGAESEG